MKMDAPSCTSKHTLLLLLLLLSNGQTRLIGRAEPILRPGAAGAWGGVSEGEEEGGNP